MRFAIFFLIHDLWMVRNGAVRLSSFSVPGSRVSNLGFFAVFASPAKQSRFQVAPVFSRLAKTLR
ncbi:hypothetical protein KAU04_07975 [bacterium]|nr:hypothetical protein [bacterium]